MNAGLFNARRPDGLRKRMLKNGDLLRQIFSLIFEIGYLRLLRIRYRSQAAYFRLKTRYLVFKSSYLFPRVVTLQGKQVDLRAVNLADTGEAKQAEAGFEKFTHEENQTQP